MRVLKGEELLNAYGFHVAETRLTSDASTFRHAHDFYELFLVTSGQLMHMSGSSEHPLSEGALCLVLPEDEHCFRRLGAKDAAFINLAFHSNLYGQARQIFASFSDGADCARAVTIPPPLLHALKMRIQFLSGTVVASSTLPTSALMMGLLLDAICYLSGFGRSGPESPLWLRRAMDAMHDEQNAQLGISRLVSLSGKSQEYLTRTMKRYYGMTPSEYVNALRLSEAARLLRNTNRSVLDIQLECGFESSSHFNQRFKREFGMSPSKYRQQNLVAIDPIK